MENQSIPVEISTVIHAALRAAVGESMHVYARGLKTDADGNPDASVTEIKRRCPLVDIIPSECVPQGHGSRLQSYPVGIRVVTIGPQDQWQETLYEGARLVGEWLANAPTLPLTLAKFDALVVEDAPDTGDVEPNLQYIEWRAIVRTTRKASE